jgi:transcriptional regulator with XRE-family HTH domain
MAISRKYEAIMARTTDEWEARLGEQVRAERLRRGIDQASLAREANVSTASLSALENGVGSRLSTLIKVARALGRESWLEELAPLSEISPLAMLRDRGRTTPRRRAPRRSSTDTPDTSIPGGPS